jgi:hypothetical protein
MVNTREMRFYPSLPSAPSADSSQIHSDGPHIRVI